MGHKGAHVTVVQVRRVWAVLTENPQLTYRELSRVSGLSHSNCRTAMARLQRLGYIEPPRGQQRATRVLVPFVEVRHGD